MLYENIIRINAILQILFNIDRMIVLEFHISDIKKKFELIEEEFLT